MMGILLDAHMLKQSLLHLSMQANGAWSLKLKLEPSGGETRCRRRREQLKNLVYQVGAAHNCGSEIVSTGVINSSFRNYSFY